MDKDTHSDGATVWVLADDRAGNVAQAMGVAEALDYPFVVKQIRYNLWGVVHNLVRAASRRGLSRWSRKAIEQKPPPQLVIGAGRRTAPLARWFKRRYSAKIVQIMDPGWPGRDDFDLIIAPKHDELPPAANLFQTFGSCHPARKSRLAAAAALWQTRLPDLPRPWTLVAVGGATSGSSFGAAEVMQLAQQCAPLPGSLFVVTSRRTGRRNERLLRQAMPPPSYFYGWTEGGDNPYLGLLALADQVVVTGDSMSMCSEACANGGPVFIFQPERGLPRKYRLFHQDLFAACYARPLSAADFTPWRHPPLDASQEAANEIRQRGLI
jgi:mitochondrial fission protein ELM1